MNFAVLGHHPCGIIRCRKCWHEHDCQWQRDSTCEKHNSQCIAGRDTLCRMCRPLSRLCSSCRQVYSWCRGCSRVLPNSSWAKKAVVSDVAYAVCDICVIRRVAYYKKRKEQKNQDKKSSQSKQHRALDVKRRKLAPIPVCQGLFIRQLNVMECQRGNRYIFSSLDEFQSFIRSQGPLLHFQHRRYGSLIQRGEDGSPDVFIGKRVNPCTTFFTMNLVCQNRGSLIRRDVYDSKTSFMCNYLRVKCGFVLQAKVLVDETTRLAGRVLVTCTSPHNTKCLNYMNEQQQQHQHQQRCISLPNSSMGDNKGVLSSNPIPPAPLALSSSSSSSSSSSLVEAAPVVAG